MKTYQSFLNEMGQESHEQLKKAYSAIYDEQKKILEMLQKKLEKFYKEDDGYEIDFKPIQFKDPSHFLTCMVRHEDKVSGMPHPFTIMITPEGSYRDDPVLHKWILSIRPNQNQSSLSISGQDHSMEISQLTEVEEAVEEFKKLVDQYVENIPHLTHSLGYQVLYALQNELGLRGSVNFNATGEQRLEKDVDVKISSNVDGKEKTFTIPLIISFKAHSVAKGNVVNPDTFVVEASLKGHNKSEGSSFYEFPESIRNKIRSYIASHKRSQGFSLVKTIHLRRLVNDKGKLDLPKALHSVLAAYSSKYVNTKKIEKKAAELRDQHVRKDGETVDKRYVVGLKIVGDGVYENARRLILSAVNNAFNGQVESQNEWLSGFNTEAS